MKDTDQIAAEAWDKIARYYSIQIADGTGIEHIKAAISKAFDAGYEAALPPEKRRKPYSAAHASDPRKVLAIKGNIYHGGNLIATMPTYEAAKQICDILNGADQQMANRRDNRK